METSPSVTQARSPDSIKKLPDEELTTFIKVEGEAVRQIVSDAYRDCYPHQVNLGIALKEAKRRFGKHGKWIDWIRKNLPFDERMSQYYIRLANKADTLKALPEAKAKRISLLSFRTLRDLTERADRPNEPKQKRPAKKHKPSKPRIADNLHSMAVEVVNDVHYLLGQLDPDEFETLLGDSLRRMLAEADKRLERARAVEQVSE